MPKVKSTFMDRQNQIRAWIQYGKTIEGLKLTDLAKRMGMPPTTLSYRISHPETMRLDEFWRLETVIGKYTDFNRR